MFKNIYWIEDRGTDFEIRDINGNYSTIAKTKIPDSFIKMKSNQYVNLDEIIQISDQYSATHPDKLSQIKFTLSNGRVAPHNYASDSEADAWSCSIKAQVLSGRYRSRINVKYLWGLK